MKLALAGLLLFFSYFGAGCATPSAVRFEAQDYPLRLLQSVAIEVLPVGKRRVSANGREFYSEYFFPKGNAKFWAAPKANSPVRYTAVIKVLGGERPYVVEISVIKEVYQKSWSSSQLRFVEAGSNKGASQELANYYREKLAKGLKDRNVIDDFRVF